MTPRPPVSLDDGLRAQIRDALARLDRLAADWALLRRAAVVVGLVEEGMGANLQGIDAPDTWSRSAAILLTLRSCELRNHAGQWALPGGTIDPGESVSEAALRELREEVGLHVGSDAVLGCLDDFTTRSGFVITPVVVWIGRALAPIANPAEVASIHRIPLCEFMRPDSPVLDAIADSEHPVLRMPIGSTWIAAPTAAILYQFRELCIAGRTTRVAHFEQPVFARQ